MSAPTNENCRGCGARLTKVVCPYCGRRADLSRDKVTPDPKDDPARTVTIRKIMC